MSSTHIILLMSCYWFPVYSLCLRVIRMLMNCSETIRRSCSFLPFYICYFKFFLSLICSLSWRHCCCCFRCCFHCRCETCYSMCMYTESDNELSLMGSRGQTRRAAIGQRRRRRRDVTGQQDGDDSRLPLAVMTSISDVSHETSSNSLNPRLPLPAIHSQSRTYYM